MAFDMDLKVTVWHRDGGHCFRCGHAVWQGDIHHRLARKAGGANSRLEWINWVSNLILACRGCHDWIEDNPKFSRAAGWMLSDFQDPEDVMVWCPWEGFWYRLHGPQFYKDPLTGMWSPRAGEEPRLWSERAALV